MGGREVPGRGGREVPGRGLAAGRGCRGEGVRGTAPGSYLRLYDHLASTPPPFPHLAPPPTTPPLTLGLHAHFAPPPPSPPHPPHPPLTLWLHPNLGQQALGHIRQLCGGAVAVGEGHVRTLTLLAALLATAL